MFYERELMNSKSLGKVWRTGHGLNEECEEDVSLMNICDKLESWVDSSHVEIHRRLSLRTSSVFIDGAARLYKRKLELLFEDIQRLEEDMCKRKRFRGQIDNEIVISQTFTEPEFQDRTKSDLTESSEMMLASSHLDTTNTTNTNRERSNRDISDVIELTNRVNRKIDKGVQTSPKKQNTRRFNQNLPDLGSFDQNLPFGFVVIHDNYHSRIPSRIIFSSLSPDVGKLV